MKDPKTPPESEKVPGKQGLEKLKDLTKRILSVPKSEIEDDKPKDPTPHPA